MSGSHDVEVGGLLAHVIIHSDGSNHTNTHSVLSHCWSHVSYLHVVFSIEHEVGDISVLCVPQFGLGMKSF